jgi:hypothetical protein
MFVLIQQLKYFDGVKIGVSYDQQIKQTKWTETNK